MFIYYGRKARAASSYPAPLYPIVVEPFAGSMAYSLHHRPAHAIGIERDRNTHDLWHRLTTMTAEEITEFPAPVVGERSTDRWVIQASASAGAATCNYRTVSEFMLTKFEEQRRYALRHRAYARTVLYSHGDYRQAPDYECTWFIDPPYQQVATGYRHGPATIDYDELAEWCMTRRGQVIICEDAAASWLPFRPHGEFLGLTVNDPARKVSEHVLTRTTHARCAHCGVTFPATRSDAKYCSPRCRVAVHRANRSRST